MKLCRKCIDTILLVANDELMYVPNKDHRGNPPEMVPESECEFWAHKDLNGLIDWVRKFSKYLQSIGVLS